MSLWKNLILSWFIILGGILVYSLLVDGGINANDNSRYLGIAFWMVTIMVSAFPLFFILLHRRLIGSVSAIKLSAIALLCPFVGSVYVFIKINKKYRSL